MIELGRAIREARTKGDRAAIVRHALGKDVPIGEVLLAVAAANSDDEPDPKDPAAVARHEVAQALAAQKAEAAAALKAAEDGKTEAQKREDADLDAKTPEFTRTWLANAPLIAELTAKGAVIEPKAVKQEMLAGWGRTAGLFDGNKDKWPAIKTFGASREDVDRFVLETYASTGKPPTSVEALDHIEKALRTRIESLSVAQPIESARGETTTLPPQPVTAAWQRGAVPSAEHPAPQTLQEKRDALKRSKGWIK